MAYKRSVLEKHKLRKLYGDARNGRLGGAYYDERKRRIMRYSYNNKSIRRIHNRRFRRFMKRSVDNDCPEFGWTIMSRGLHKKYSDYIWDIL